MIIQALFSRSAVCVANGALYTGLRYRAYRARTVDASIDNLLYHNPPSIDDLEFDQVKPPFSKDLAVPA
jgi:hypothetical protein